MTNDITKLYNVYANIPSERLINVNVWVDKDDHRLLTSVYPVQGRWQSIVSTLFKSIADELRRNNVTQWSPESESVVRSLVARRADPRPLDDNNRHDDGGGTTKDDRADTPAPLLTGDTKRSVKSRGRKGAEGNRRNKKESRRGRDA